MSRFLALVSAFLALPAGADVVLLAQALVMPHAAMVRVQNADTTAPVMIRREWRVGGTWMPLPIAPAYLLAGETAWVDWPLAIRPAAIRAVACWPGHEQPCSVASNEVEVP